MPDEIDRETTTNRVTSNSSTPGDGYKVSEQQSTTRVTKDDNSGLIVGILLALALSAGALAYFVNNNRQVPPTQQIIVPAPGAVRENKSTVIERNNTTIKEVSPAPAQPTPKVEVNVPAPIVQPAAPVPAPTVTIQPQPAVTSAPTPAATTQPQTTATPTSSPRPTN